MDWPSEFSRIRNRPYAKAKTVSGLITTIRRSYYHHNRVGLDLLKIWILTFNLREICKLHLSPTKERVGPCLSSGDSEYANGSFLSNQAQNLRLNINNVGN